MSHRSIGRTIVETIGFIGSIKNFLRLMFDTMSNNDKKTQQTNTFPSKLYTLLSDESISDTICWLPQELENIETQQTCRRDFATIFPKFKVRFVPASSKRMGI